MALRKKVQDSSIEFIARALVVHQRQVLLCWSLRGGYAYLPGGHIEFGETAARAVVRELREEVTGSFRASGLAGVHEHAFPGHHEVNLVFHVERRGRAELRSRESHIAFSWHPLSSLKRIDLRPASLASMIPRLVKGRSPMWWSEQPWTIA